MEVRGIRRFFDGFGGCDGRNVGSWTALGGRWRVLPGSAGELAESLGQFEGGAAVTLAGEPHWEDYDLRCLLRAAGPHGIGVLFHYLDAGHYDLVRWAGPESALAYAGRIEFVRRRGVVDRVLASRRLQRAPDRWYALRMRRCGGAEAISIDGTDVLSVAAEPDARGRVGLFGDGGGGSFFDNIYVDRY